MADDTLDEQRIRLKEFLGRGVEKKDRRDELLFLHRLREQANPNLVTPDGHIKMPEDGTPS